MSKIAIVNLVSLSLENSFSAFFEEKEVQGLIISPNSGKFESASQELPFNIQATNMSIPTIKEEFCLSSRVKINLAEQHVYEKEATEAGNNILKTPQTPLKENNSFTELKGEHG